MLVWQEARRQAQAITRDTPITDTGLADLTAIAQRFGATVTIHPLEPEISGVVHKPTPYTPPAITINSDEPIVRQRFTLAHEIGHLVDRMIVAHDPDYSFIDYRDGGPYDLHEFFADEFAGELLMPAKQFQKILDSRGPYHASVTFGVSVMAVQKRAERLRRNPPEC